jgi:hypothetical protein
MKRVLAIFCLLSISLTAFADTNLDNDIAECKAIAIDRGYFLSAATSLCSVIETHGQAKCLEGTIPKDFFIRSAHEYCSYITTDAQGICMGGAAKEGIFTSIARKFCGITAPAN